MEWSTELVTFAGLGLLVYLIDMRLGQGRYNTCIRRPEFHLTVIVHHILTLFLMFGWVSSDRRLVQAYVVLVVVVLVHWLTNDNRCVLTETANRMCDIPRDEPFHEFWYFAGWKTDEPAENNWLSIYLLIVFGWSVYRLTTWPSTG